MIGRYIDSVESGYDDMVNHSFKECNAPMLNPLFQLLDQPKKWGTLHYD